MHLHEKIGLSDSKGNVSFVSPSTDACVLPSDSCDKLFEEKISLPLWCASITNAVFRTRTPFAAFVRFAIHLSRDDSHRSLSPAFPIPLPYFGVFDRMPLGLSQHRRAKIHFRRAVVLVTLALNFWWSGNKFIDKDLLRRVPSSPQLLIIERIKNFMQADGFQIPVPVVSAGRRFPQLIARLSELSSALTNLGPQSSPYSHVFEGKPKVVEQNNEVRDDLQPYRSLDASRLKLVGTGSWDPLPFLDDNLSMAFTNPDCLIYPCDYTFASLPKMEDPASEILAIARRWDDLGLLYLHPFDVPSAFPQECVKIFNCFKDQKNDRQIGDRRGRNFTEMAVRGPSKGLPSGADLCELFVDASSQKVSISITDRKDFYHQFAVSETRAQSNTLHCGIPVSLLADTNAYAAFTSQFARSREERLKSGDGLFAAPRFPKLPRRRKFDVLYPAFNSILQGDHGGVEYACQAHSGLLETYGLLSEQNRLVADRPFRGDSLLEGLVIDDYFSIGISDKCSPSPSPDLDCFDVAQQAYSDHGLIGSPLKDIRGSSRGKVIGAEINADADALRRSICTLGSPVAKRYSLAWITLQICCLPCTTDVLHLCLLGGWVACLTYRRPLMSILNASFRLVDASTIDSNNPRMISLPRAVANELTILSLLVCLAVSDLGAPPCGDVFCTDASLQKGAICSAALNPQLGKILWKITRSKGAYHRLLTPLESISKRLGLLEEKAPVEVVAPPRPLAFCYDFLEVFSGSAKVSDSLSKLGFVIGPPIDLSVSPEYNMEYLHVISWITHMVASGQLCSFMAEPPCTTFSIMRKPPLRSRLSPFGFDTSHVQTSNGNLLAHRALQLMWVGLQNQVPGLLEKPLSSLLKHMPSYKNLLSQPFVRQCRTDSCMFGSIHQKSFRFVSVHLDLDRLAARCDRSHCHVPIAGGYTKASATYVDRLADRLAEVLSVGIKLVKDRVSAFEALPSRGLENQVVNSIALSSEWKVVDDWCFRKSSHINILEFSVLGRLAKCLASRGSSVRAVSFVDSFVVSAAASKGRTSSVGLAPVLRRYNAVCVAAGLYINTPFCPTRLNPSDDPSRDQPLREPSGCFDVRSWDCADLFRLSALPKLRRWSSNWVRLTLSLMGPRFLDLTDRSFFRCSLPWTLCSQMDFAQMDFDSTLGFPGEGPSVSLLLLCWLCCCVSGSWSVGPSCLFGALAMASVSESMLPRNNADLTRQLHRQSRPTLVSGRPVLPATTLNRDNLFKVFDDWCATEEICFSTLLENALKFVEEINVILVKYGKLLYSSGRPYGHYSETINSVVSRKAILRRQLQMAWDYAFAWVKAEPPTHHMACPWQILLAIVGTSLLWGWCREAGIFAMTWGGLLRAGEATSALRRDLLLPADTQDTNQFALVSISEPKTRFTVARHQTAKIDAPDLVRVMHLAFFKLPQNERLWPYSSQTLRNRFKTVLASLSLHVSPSYDLRQLDLGSLRPGGATWLLQTTEQSELVRRRGRWISARVMEVYLQEVGAAKFMNALNADQKEKIYGMAFGFPHLLTKAEQFFRAGVSSTVWFKIFCSL